ETLFREALSMNRKLLGEGHPDVAVSLVMLAFVLQKLKEYGEAERLLRQENEPSGPHPLEANSLFIPMSRVTNFLREKGEDENTRALCRQALAMGGKLYGDEHPSIGENLHDFAVLLYLEGEYAEAEKTERQAIDIFQKALEPGHWG